MEPIIKDTGPDNGYGDRVHQNGGLPPYALTKVAMEAIRGASQGIVFRYSTKRGRKDVN